MISPARRRVLLAIEDYMAEHGWSPSVRELCKATGLSSTSTVHMHLTALERDGYIERTPNRYVRAIRRTERRAA